MTTAFLKGISASGYQGFSTPVIVNQAMAEGIYRLASYKAEGERRRTVGCSPSASTHQNIN
jgi:hypothetical protein